MKLNKLIVSRKVLSLFITHKIVAISNNAN